MSMRPRLEEWSSSNGLPFEIRLPSPQRRLDQDQEWCEIRKAGDPTWRRIRFHDYHEIYNVPGLYEAIFYDTLACNSPQRVVGLLEEVMQEQGRPETLRVLDVGAGNGMVGEELRRAGADTVVGVDIIDEAAQATQRDRPGLYDDYLITDLTDLPEAHEEALRDASFNCMTTVAALGYGDIPPKAFTTALDVVENEGWLGFNIKETFVREQDESGFSRLIRSLAREQVIEIQAWRRYQHRLNIEGEPLYYVAMVAKKLRDVPDDYREPLVSDN